MTWRTNVVALATLVRNKLASRRFAARVAKRGGIGGAQIAVFFGSDPGKLYMLDAWLPVLRELNEQHPVAVIVTRPDTGQAIFDRVDFPIVFADSSGHLDAAVAAASFKVFLYVNNAEINFRALRFSQVDHVHLGHGESDKDSSVSNHSKAYDYVLVAGPAGKERLARTLRNFDADARVRMIGRPQLDHTIDVPDAFVTGGVTVLYAPTWEGDRAATAHGSAVSHGHALIKALDADPHVTIIFRPHPNSGARDTAYGSAVRALKEALLGTRHFVDDGPWGWQTKAADLCITDLSAIAYDWLATGKPLIVTQPEGVESTNRLLAETPRLTASDCAHIRTFVERQLETPPDLTDLRTFYLGDTTKGAPTKAFESFMDSLIPRAWRGFGR
ncbi:CDP-glycerol glycerophosphotransferase family protein [soil metagenome]